MLNPAGSALRYSTFLGGSQGGKCPCAKSVALGPDGDVYLAGKTYSPDIPVTSDAFQTALVPRSSAGKDESVNAFEPRVMKLNSEYLKALPLTTITVTSNANPATKGSSVTFTAQVSSVRKGGSVPTGEVGFDLWGVSWESVTLNAEGVARLTVPASQLPRGESHMVVMYLGDDTHAPSNANMTEVVE